ncbi:MAG: hypothetical protein ABGZ36_21950 [Actinomycetota bacterium]|uniref:hypothetical protein n=1 Tax=Euzebya rosea TaxID=2052804 RepID=UPI001300B72D|nr:hypothetical protein [Euzebya rosea]
MTLDDGDGGPGVVHISCVDVAAMPTLTAELGMGWLWTVLGDREPDLMPWHEVDGLAISSVNPWMIAATPDRTVWRVHGADEPVELVARPRTLPPPGDLDQLHRAGGTTEPRLDLVPAWTTATVERALWTWLRFFGVRGVTFRYDAALRTPFDDELRKRTADHDPVYGHLDGEWTEPHG